MLLVLAILLRLALGALAGWAVEVTALGPLPTWDRGTDYFCAR